MEPFAMPASPSSLRELLPFWALFPLPKAAFSGLPEVPSFVPCLLLKDGTLVVGLTLDVGDVPARLEKARARYRQVLAGLPEGGFVQIVLRPRDTTCPRRGPHATLCDDSSAQATLWVGVKRCLRAEGGDARAAPSTRHDMRCHAFVRSLMPAWMALRRDGVALPFLTEGQVVAACHDTFYGEFLCRPAPAMPSWRDAHLDAALACGRLTIDAEHAAWRPPWQAPARFIQASSIEALDEHPRPSGLAASLLADGPAGGWTWSVTLEKSEQSLQREKLQQRRKWLVAFGSNTSLKQEAEHAQQQAQALLAELDGQGSQLFRATVSCLTTAEDTANLAKSTRQAQRVAEQHGARLQVQEQQQQAVIRSALPGCGYASPTGLSLLDREAALWLPLQLEHAPDKDRQSLGPRSA